MSIEHIERWICRVQYFLFTFTVLVCSVDLMFELCADMHRFFFYISSHLHLPPEMFGEFGSFSLSLSPPSSAFRFCLCSVCRLWVFYFCSFGLNGELNRPGRTSCVCSPVQFVNVHLVQVGLGAVPVPVPTLVASINDCTCAFR